MHDRDGLAVRADVLSKLADQLSKQLAVERRANEELRSLLCGDIGRWPRAAAPAPSLAPVVALVAVVVTVSAVLTVAWLRASASDEPGAPRFAAASAATAAVSYVPPPPLPWPAQPARTDVNLYPNGLLRPMLRWSIDPTDCMPVVNAAAARCFVDATGGAVEGEPMVRYLFLAHTLLDEPERARAVAWRYVAEYRDSPFAPQIWRLSHIDEG